MNYLAWLIRIIVFLLLVTFAVKNTDTMTIYYYLGLEYQMPVNVALLIFFAIGLILGYLFSFSKKR